MSPPVALREEPIQVTFVDFPASVAVSHLIDRSVSYPSFLSLLRFLSGSVVNKLKSIPEHCIQGQGLTLSDGGWWYRFVKNVTVSNAGIQASEVNLEKGPWTLMDCSNSYDNMISQICLGVKWRGAWVEFQHVCCPSQAHMSVMAFTNLR